MVLTQFRRYKTDIFFKIFQKKFEAFFVRNALVYSYQDDIGLRAALANYERVCAK